jgi:spore coat polysaccharide biosynthesis predicted glycosyltransferase SpsG
VQQDNDADENLQAKIKEFTAKRTELNNEIKKEDKDAELIKALDLEVKELYSGIFEHKGMIAFAEARNGFQEMLAFVNQIINASASGEDPDTIDYEAACGGDCSGCAGCH